MPSGTLSVGVLITPNTTDDVFLPGWRPATLIARGGSASGLRSYSAKLPRGSPDGATTEEGGPTRPTRWLSVSSVATSMRMISYG
jgi:hypothetical protein